MTILIVIESSQKISITLYGNYWLDEVMIVVVKHKKFQWSERFG
jgi:hypothetical protein